MGFDWTAWVLSKTGAQAVTGTTLLQQLWGGYGELLRVLLLGGSAPSVILKRVIPPEAARETVSDRRKRRSYEVEQAWYKEGARRCGADCRVAACYGLEKHSGTCLLLLEDLETAGFRPGRPPQIRAGLRWLAHFHSQFLNERPVGLWEQGSYWHLETRRDEWERMRPGLLKEHAERLDRRLRGARYQTLVHGDSKPANFCWHTDGTAAAVDFQYVGPGCGIRDVAYFLDCCLGEAECETQMEGWLDFYFATLDAGEAVESEWRALFPVAWADYCRFYEGWGRQSAPGPYSRKQLQLALSLP